MYSKQFTNSGFVAGTHSEYVQNTIIDCLNKASTADFASISEKFPSLAADVTNTVSKVWKSIIILGLNIGNSPSYVLKEAWANGAWLLGNRSNCYSGSVCFDTMDQRKADASAGYFF